MKSKSVKINEIVIDGGTQQREKIDLAIVSEYAESMRCGAKFPPVVLFFDGAQYWLADGFQRYHASREAEFLDMLCDVHEGTNRDAVWYSAGANTAHGLRLSNMDKRKAVLVLLNDAEWSKLADAEIARHCKVTHPFVGKLRKEQAAPAPVTVTGEAPTSAPIASMTNGNKSETEELSTGEGCLINKFIDAEPEPKPAYNPADDELSEAHNAVLALATENDSLRDAIATGALPENEIKPAADTIAELRAQVASLEIVNSSITKARDQFMRENAELKKQVAAQAREIKKLKK